MRLRLSSLLLALPLLAGCSGESEPVGTAEEPIKVCPGPTVLQGVDISHYDGTIDWAKVKASGRVFAIAKATEGTTYTDPTFATNWPAMKKAGLVRSAYHFFHANADPIVEADHFLAVMGPLEPGDLPPTLDLEVTDSQSAATITANTIKWLDHVAAATGMKPLLYTSPSFVTGTLGSPAGLENHAQLWVANWGVTCPDVPAPFTTWPFWQNDDKGTVPGIPAAAVDLDEFNGDMAALTALTKPGASSSSSSSSSSTGSSSSGGSGTSSGGTGGGAGTSSGGTGGDSDGTGGSATHSGGSVHVSSHCAAAPSGNGGGDAARGWLLALAGALTASRARRRRRG